MKLTAWVMTATESGAIPHKYLSRAQAKQEWHLQRCDDLYQGQRLALRHGPTDTTVNVHPMLRATQYFLSGLFTRFVDLINATKQAFLL